MQNLIAKMAKRIGRMWTDRPMVLNSKGEVILRLNKGVTKRKGIHSLSSKWSYSGVKILMTILEPKAELMM